MSKKAFKQLIILLTAIFLLSLHHRVFAAAFQLWEEDGASVGNYHAGRAAVAEDASTSFYNPAGLIRIPNQQLVLGMVPITTSFLYEGTIAVNTLDNNTPHNTQAQGGDVNFIPNLHYAAPLLNNLSFGLSVVFPYGLETKYSKSSIVRYAATTTSIHVLDLAPALGFAINNKFSIGFGADIEFSDARFDLVATAFTPALDTDATNSFSGHGLGYHGGILYQITPKTHLGLAYQSKVTHHFHDGKSRFAGPLANNGEGGVQSTHKAKTKATVPATTTMSMSSALNKAWDVMMTVSYTEWNVFNKVVLKNISGINDAFEKSNQITVIIPQHFHNTWNYSVGANYHFNDQWFLRTGVGYDQTPSNNQDRNLQLPDSNRTVVALGTHFQSTKTLGFDVGWSHFFTHSVPLNVTQPVGGQITTTQGEVTENADVYGFQMTWDIV